MMRGINRQSIFEDEEDKYKFIETLIRYKEISCYRLFAYCLMDNHVHILFLFRFPPSEVSYTFRRIPY